MNIVTMILFGQRAARKDFTKVCKDFALQVHVKEICEDWSNVAVSDLEDDVLKNFD